jgi:type IV pilus assembly protein PilC
MTYPIFVVIVAVVVVIVIMVRVVPTLTAVFASMGGELPAITMALVNTSNFFARWWLVIGIVILAIVVGSKLYFGTEKGRLVKGKLLLKLPISGNPNILSGSAQFASTMSVMLLSGLTVNRATEVTSRVMTNAIMQDDVAAMTGRLEEGHPLGECIMKCDYFPENLRQMTAIGEESGELAETLSVVGDYYTNEADHATAAAVAKLEPAILVFLAGFAGFIVIAIYMAMFSMYAVM